MLTYTFSAREKVLLTILGFLGVLVVWYQLVFVNVQTQLSDLDSQIASAQDEMIIAQSRAVALQNMRKVVEEYEAQGIDPVLLPDYDNTQNLMAYLNGVLSVSTDYNMSFDNPEISEDDGNVHRTGIITYTTESYEQARAIAENVGYGPYPCTILSMSISDKSKETNPTDTTVTTSLQVTFMENPPAGMTVQTEDDTPEGQDLSQLSQWNS